MNLDKTIHIRAATQYDQPVHLYHDTVMQVSAGEQAHACMSVRRSPVVPTVIQQVHYHDWRGR